MIKRQLNCFLRYDVKYVMNGGLYRRAEFGCHFALYVNRQCVPSCPFNRSDSNLPTYFFNQYCFIDSKCLY